MIFSAPPNGASALALLVPRIAANHAHHALAPHDFAIAADFFD
jgi:hypothetical protein